MAFVIMCECYTHSNPWSLEGDKRVLVDKIPTAVCDTEEEARRYLNCVYDKTSLHLDGWKRGYDTNENHAQFLKDGCTKERMYIIRFVMRGGEKDA